MAGRSDEDPLGPAVDLPADSAERLTLAKDPGTDPGVLARLYRDEDSEISQAARKSLRQTDPARLRELLKADLAARLKDRKRRAFQRDWVEPTLRALAEIGIDPQQVPQDQVGALHRMVQQSGDLHPISTALHSRVPQIMRDFFGRDTEDISAFIAENSPVPPDEIVTALDDFDELALQMPMADFLRGLGILYDGYRGHLCLLDGAGTLVAVVRKFKTTCVRLGRPRD